MLGWSSSSRDSERMWLSLSNSIPFYLYLDRSEIQKLHFSGFLITKVVEATWNLSLEGHSPKDLEEGGKPLFQWMLERKLGAMCLWDLSLHLGIWLFACRYKKQMVMKVAAVTTSVLWTILGGDLEIYPQACSPKPAPPSLSNNLST